MTYKAINNLNENKMRIKAFAFILIFKSIFFNSFRTCFVQIIYEKNIYKYSVHSFFKMFYHLYLTLSSIFRSYPNVIDISLHKYHPIKTTII